MATKNNVPLWLDIKTEYIDENFEKVLNYLKSGNKNDAFYKTTIELLGQRVEEYLKTLKTRPAYFSENTSNYDLEKLTFESRLVAAYLLASRDDGDVIKRKRLYMPFLHSLSLLVPADMCGDLLGLMMDNMIYKDEPVLLFGWDDVVSFEPQILAHKIIYGKSFPKAETAETRYEMLGCATIWDNALGIAPLNLADLKKKKEQIASSIDVIGGKLKLITTKNEKLKQSDEDNIDLIAVHARNFVEEQSRVKPSSEKRKKEYAKGDTLIAEITKCVWESVEVKSIDPEYEQIEGTLCFTDANTLYYYPSDFYKYLEVGQNIDVKITSLNKKQFSLKDRFIEYVIEDIVEGEGHIGNIEPAKVAKVYADKRGAMQMDWLTKSGFPVHTPYDDRFEPNDFAMIRIDNVASGAYYGYVSGEVDGEPASPFDFQMSKKKVIEGFNFEGYDNEDADEKESMMTTGAIRDLLNMLVRYQKTIVQPVERFRTLCVSWAIATLIASEGHQSYIKFLISYLKQLINFAKGDYEKIEALSPDANIADVEVVQQRCTLVRVLRTFEKENEQEELNSIMSESQDEKVINIARLIHSCNIIGEIVPASTKNIIKREIVKNLSLEMEDETNLEEGNGIYLGIENLHQEFKTSFVYPPDNDMQPNVAIQEKNIFRCLCGFLNSEGGGTLYIGVTDLGYVCGFENDMKYLRMNGLDSYMRFIQDEAKKYFTVDVLNQFVIKPMYEDKVIAIRVEPYMGDIVEFQEKAFIRINNETREMNEKLRKIIKARKTTK